MLNRHRRVLAGGLAAATLTVSLAAWQLPAGASGAKPGEKPGTKPVACSQPAPKDAGAAQDAKRAEYAGTKEARLKDDALKAAKAKGKKPDTPDQDERCKDDRRTVDVKALSKKFGIPADQLEAGLLAAKRAGGGQASVDAFAQAAGVSKETAALVVRVVFGDAKDEADGRAELAKAVAARLGVSAAAVEQALERLNSAGGIDPDSALFASVARALGVSPQRLQDALVASKQGATG